MKIKAGIVGATGYAGAELVRLLTAHPEAEISAISSVSFEGDKLSDVYPSYTFLNDMVCENQDAVVEKSDVIFAALPHGLSQELAAKCIDAGKAFIDLGADFRLESEEEYTEWYGGTFLDKKLHEQAVYGLPEFFRDKIKGKKLVAECKADLRNMDINFNENIQVGVMVETASAAVIADMLAKEADFFSIGTNDLTGYTMACDRGNNDVSYLYSPLQPSVLRMIKRTIECGVQNGISVGMCGEAAANKLMIPLLISFGLTEFSVSAPSVLNVRKIISTWTKEEADKVTAKVLEMSTQQEIVEYLNSVV